MINSKCSATTTSLPMDALTPLSSTRDAAFVIQMDDNSATDSFAYKMRTKTRILYTVPEGRSVRTESNQPTQSNRQCPYLGDEPADAKGEWSTSFGGGYRNCSDVLMLACCPCVPAAKIHGMLGSSFESGVIYFGGLVFGLLISIGLCFSNNTSTLTATSSDNRTAATSITVTTTTSSTHIYGNLAVVLLVVFLLGVAFLRTRTRHRFSIPGSRAFDCCLSALCCWCVLAQAQSHLEKHNRHEFGLDTPSSDTLPAYT